jgi:hypothetical protein
MRLCLALAATLLLTSLPAYAELPARYSRPVKAVAPTLMDVPYASGMAAIPVYASADMTKPQPDVTRVVLIFHGLLRNADSYFEAGLEAQRAAGPAGTSAIVMAPQFLATSNIPAHNLPANTLGWPVDAWAGGEPATTPAPLSGFDAVDAILVKLSDRSLFPKLRTVVIAGFSAGGQIVQRYAVVGEGEAALTKAGIGTEYVVSDPSSYLYFSAERPLPNATCANADRWRYGFDGAVPPYVKLPPAALEARYVARHVTYLIGMADTDPNHPLLDKSCAGETQGPQRFARGHNYFSMLQQRDGGALRHVLIDVPGIAHEGRKMFNSPCGLRALFGTPGCAEIDGNR